MVGIFDSGFGGLTTLKELLHFLPEYSYLYLGDSARAPYGNRSAAEVQSYTEEGVEFLFSKGATVVLIACNTASSDALGYLQKKYEKNNSGKKVLGVLIPAVEKALEVSRYGSIGVVGTQGTILSKKFEIEIEKRTSQYYFPQSSKARSLPQVFSQACPLLVPLIEEGWAKKPETTMIVKKYLTKLKTCNIDTLILGCTHYPILEKIFARKMGKNCRIINSGLAQAEKFVEYLSYHSEVENTIVKSSQQKFFTTGCPQRFKEFSQIFLGRRIGNVEKISFTTYG